jgi:hypothetical protein
MDTITRVSQTFSAALVFFDAIPTGWVSKHHSVGLIMLQCRSSNALAALQNTEILKQIFPEKEYWGLSPNFHMHASVSDLYIPTIGLPILLEEICRTILGQFKSLTDT